MVTQGHHIGVIYYFYWSNGEHLTSAGYIGDCKYPSIVADDSGNLHALYGAGVFSSWELPGYIYIRKAKDGGWSNPIHLGRRWCPGCLLLFNNLPLFSLGYTGSFEASWRVQDSKGNWFSGIFPYVQHRFYGGSMTADSQGEWVYYGQNFCMNIFKLVSRDEGKTWVSERITDDGLGHTAYNWNGNPICAWSLFNFPPGLENLFFFQKNTPKRRSPYQLWVGGEFAEGGVNIINLLHCQPAVFDPYEKDGKTTLYYTLNRKVNLTLEILNSSKHIVKSVDLGTKESGSDGEQWWGVIDCPEIGLDNDKGVFLAPDGEYTIRLKAKNIEDEKIIDTKEVKVKIETSW